MSSELPTKDEQFIDFLSRLRQTPERMRGLGWGNQPAHELSFNQLLALIDVAKKAHALDIATDNVPDVEMSALHAALDNLKALS